MGIFLSRRELAVTEPAETATFRSPVPTRMVSNGEFNPLPQTPQQRRFEARLKELADTTAQKFGTSRRNFLRTSCGMAAAFVALNDVFGKVFEVAPAEAAEPEAAAARAQELSGQFILDDQLHFVRDDYNVPDILFLAKYAGQYWNPGLLNDQYGLTLDRYKFDNFLKEVYLDSDTKIGLLSGAPFDNRAEWFLTNDQIKQAADTVNRIAGSNRLLFHSVITPLQPGWMEEVDRCIEQVKPNSWKGYTIGDPLNVKTTKYPWRLDDEKVMYPFYEKAVKAGITTVCIHKGLLPADYATAIPGGAWKYATVDDLPKAAKDWPQINFVIYHSALRPFAESPDAALAAFEKTGYIEWVSDLAAIPDKHGVANVYADICTSFAMSATANPRFCAAFMGTLVKGLGRDHVFWGTDSVWYGSPQWQIEALRRLEIPEDMRKKHGFSALGPANGEVKNAIFGANAVRFYKLEHHAELTPWQEDGLGKLKTAYLDDHPARTNAA
jgi:predicted TIM-barrel fold metal-dependent hydrolase